MGIHQLTGYLLEIVYIQFLFSVVNYGCCLYRSILMNLREQKGNQLMNSSRKGLRIDQKNHLKSIYFFFVNIFDSLLIHSCTIRHQGYLKQYMKQRRNSLILYYFQNLMNVYVFLLILLTFKRYYKNINPFRSNYSQFFQNQRQMGPAVLIPVGMAATWGTAVGVGMAVNDNSNVPSHRGEYVVQYRYGQVVQTWSYNPDELVIYLKTKSCRLIHGSVSWLTTALKNTVTLGLSDPLEHWWIIIETTAAYYVIQFYSNNVYTMVRCTSEYDCNMNGLNCVNNESNATIWTENQYTGNPRKGVKLGDIVQWIKQKNFSAQYDLMRHNCQDLCKAVWRAF